MTDLAVYQPQNQVLATYDDVEKAAKAMAASGFFQDTKQASQAIVKILAAREIGFGPFAGMTGINIIQGKPAFGANIMAAAVKRSGRYNYRVTEMSDKACVIEFMELFSGKWQPAGVSSFTVEDARKAGTKNTDKFPRNMLFARAMSNGVRWYCPDVMNGSVVYTPEELGAEVDQDGEVVSQTWEVVPVEAKEEAPALDPNLGTDWIVGHSDKIAADKPFTLEDALVHENSEGQPYGELTSNKLAIMWNAMAKSIEKNHLEGDERAKLERKMKAAKMIMDARKSGEIADVK